MIKKLFIVISCILSTTLFASDSTSFVILVRYDMKSDFFKCSRSDFSQIVDESYLSTSDNTSINFLKIDLYQDSILFSSTKGSMAFKVIFRNREFVEFESFERDLATGVSLCNREIFKYRLLLPHKDNSNVKLYYDMSVYKKPDQEVFIGKCIPVELILNQNYFSDKKIIRHYERLPRTKD